MDFSVQYPHRCPTPPAPKSEAGNAPAQATGDAFKAQENQDLGLMPKPQGPEGPNESMASYIGKGALYGAALGFIAPALTIIGLAATLITVPLGAVLGAFAGASAYTTRTTSLKAKSLRIFHRPASGEEAGLLAFARWPGRAAVPAC